MNDVATLLGSPQDWLRDIAISAAFSLWLALMGPFGFYRLGPLEMRIAYGLFMGLIFVVSYGLVSRAAVHYGKRIGVSPWISAPAAYLLVSLPMSQVVIDFTMLFFPQILRTPPIANVYPQLLIIQLPVVFAYLAAEHVLERRGRPPAAESPPAPAAPCRLARRLPVHLPREILALQAEDHYVRVHTPAGSTLLHGRLVDAIAELDGLAGLRVHRSWWVASGAIRMVIATGRRMTLKLSNGAEAPVARDAAPQVKQLVAA